MGALLVVNCLGLSFPLMVKAMIDRLEGKPQAFWVPDVIATLPPLAFILSLAFLFLSFIAMITLGRYYWRVHFIFSGLPRTHEVRKLFYRSLIEKDSQFLRSRRVGDFISALTEDSEKIRMTLAFGALAICDTALNLVLFSVILFFLDSYLAVRVLPPLILSACLLVILSDRLSLYYEKVQDLIGSLTGFAFEIASGVRVIKAFGREKEFHHSFLNESKKLEKASVQVARYQSVFVPFLYLCLGLATCFVMLMGGYRVLSGQLALSSFIAFQLYLVQLDWPMMAVGWFVELFRGSKASEKRMKSVATASTKMIQDPLSAISHFPTFEMEMKNVSFSFEDGTPAVSGFNLRVKKGAWVGLTGPVGSGKSTLLELLSRELDPVEGDIFWRGKNLKEFSQEDLAKNILYVPQESYLFSKSLRNNLLFGRDARLDDGELNSLLKDLSFDLEQLEGRGGLWTRLGERGTNFSGGQKQRISIGRALLHHREVYLFDDVFSHLDAETEIKILSTLKERISPHSTVFFVSQRLETLERQDELLVINSGRLEYFGSVAGARSESPFIQQLQNIQRDQMLQQEGRLIL
jgi:ATP-binding cassette subfamily B protein